MARIQVGNHCTQLRSPGPNGMPLQLGRSKASKKVTWQAAWTLHGTSFSRKCTLLMREHFYDTTPPKYCPPSGRLTGHVDWPKHSEPPAQKSMRTEGRSVALEEGKPGDPTLRLVAVRVRLVRPVDRDVDLQVTATARQFPFLRRNDSTVSNVLCETRQATTRPPGLPFRPRWARSRSAPCSAP